MSHGGMQTRNTRIGHIWDIHNKLTQPNSIKENQIYKEPAFNLKIKLTFSRSTCFGGGGFSSTIIDSTFAILYYLFLYSNNKYAAAR